MSVCSLFCASSDANVQQFVSPSLYNCLRSYIWSYLSKNSKVLDYSGSCRFLFYNSHHAKVRLIIAADVIACFPLFIVVEEQRITISVTQIHCHFSRKFLLRSSCTIYYISQFTFSGSIWRSGHGHAFF